MLTKTIWLTPILFLSLVQGGAEEKAEKAKKDLDAMQGTWVIHAMEINGKEVAPRQLEGTILIVKGDEYKTKVKKKDQSGFKLVLDPTKEPKTMDMILTQPGEADKVHKAIYKLDKDSLKVCRGLMPEQERPTQFGTWPDTGCFMVTWKKQAK